LRQLKTLVLSHNRIVSLQPLAQIADYSKIHTIDLVDNYVGDLSQIKALQGFRNLKDLSFKVVGQDQKGSNPVCDFSNYGLQV